ncbi:MAG: hypothetical protein R3B81_04980 [bacterium]
MRFTLVMVACAAAGHLAAAVASATPQTVLSCSFNDKPIDQPIGTGGAEVGEPDFVSAGFPAVVRLGPFPSPCLELSDNIPTIGYVRFGFLGDLEATTGTATVTAVMRFQQRDSFLLAVEGGDPAIYVAQLSFLDTGDLFYRSAGGLPMLVGTYSAGTEYEFVVHLDVRPDPAGGTTGTCSVLVNGVPLVTDEPFAATTGISSVRVACSADANTTGKICMDNLAVDVDEGVTSIDPAGDSGSWGRIKASWR